MTASVTSINTKFEQKSNRGMSKRLHSQAEQIATLRRLIDARSMELQAKQVDGVDYLMLASATEMLRKAFSINKAMALGESVDEYI